MSAGKEPGDIKDAGVIVSLTILGAALIGLARILWPGPDGNA